MYQKHKMPLYDLFDGLGRRRRLERIGYDPDELVEKISSPTSEDCGGGNCDWLNQSVATEQ